MNFKDNFIAFYTILHKEVTRFIRIWTQTLLPPVITQSLYFIIFGGFIGSQVKDIAGVSYMQFIVPGLVMMAIINSSFANVVSSFFGAKFQKNIEELLVSPVSTNTIIAGYTAGGVVRGLLVGAIVFGVSAFFTAPQIHNFGIILLFSTLTATIFALGGLFNAIFANKFDDISIFSTFVLTPLTYFGGVFYSIKDLPLFWQKVSAVNPILYMIDGFRYGFYGKSDFNIITSSLGLILICGILYGINYYLIQKGTGLRT
jgi:ABC-2 type transport system permease protein